VKNASFLLQNIHDKHLNVFYQYGDCSHLENNITKAIINTFESLNAEEKRRFFKDIFEVSLPDGELVYKCFLQTKPDENIISELSDSNKLLFAFSPTGKSWGYEGIDTFDKDSIRKSIRDSLSQVYSDDTDLNKNVDITFKDTMDIINNRGDSIPDAWILVRHHEKYVFCVAMENKLYDLNPYQLINHCTKSLKLEKIEENQIKYCKYSTIFDELEDMEGYLVKDFLRYMYLLNYWEVNNLSQIKAMDDEHIDTYSNRRCVQLLKEVGNKPVEWHRGWMYRFETGNDYNRMVGMRYAKETKTFEVSLYFGSTQTSARNLYNKFKRDGYELKDTLIYGNSFHFQATYRKNLDDTYYKTENFDIHQYVSFWINHADLIWQTSQNDRQGILDEMNKGGIISKKEKERILEYTDNKGKLNISPEFGIYLTWSLEEAIELDEKGIFADTIRKEIDDVYQMLGIGRFQ